MVDAVISINRQTRYGISGGTEKDIEIYRGIKGVYYCVNSKVNNSLKIYNYKKPI